MYTYIPHDLLDTCRFEVVTCSLSIVYSIVLRRSLLLMPSHCNCCCGISKLRAFSENLLGSYCGSRNLEENVPSEGLALKIWQKRFLNILKEKSQSCIWISNKPAHAPRLLEGKINNLTYLPFVDFTDNFILVLSGLMDMQS